MSHSGWEERLAPKARARAEWAWLRLGKERRTDVGSGSFWSRGQQRLVKCVTSWSDRATHMAALPGVQLTFVSQVTHRLSASLVRMLPIGAFARRPCSSALRYPTLPAFSAPSPALPARLARPRCPRAKEWAGSQPKGRAIARALNRNNSASFNSPLAPSPIGFQTTRASHSIRLDQSQARQPGERTCKVGPCEC